MGLDERDYMRERNRRTLDRALRGATERPFTRPDDKTPLIIMVGTWVSIGFILFKAYSWWEERKAPRPPLSAGMQQRSAAQPALEVPNQPMARMQAETPAARPGPPSQSVTYASPPAPEAIEPSRPQTSGTVYLCRDYGGGSFWASDHCNRHNALIDRMVSVPEGIPFAQQVQIAEQRRQVLAAPEPVRTAAAQARNPAADNKALCQSLDERVIQLDGMARQPQSGATQDWIRQERQKTRDEQFRLHC